MTWNKHGRQHLILMKLESRVNRYGFLTFKSKCSPLTRRTSYTMMESVFRGKTCQCHFSKSPLSASIPPLALHYLVGQAWFYSHKWEWAIYFYFHGPLLLKGAFHMVPPDFFLLILAVSGPKRSQTATISKIQGRRKVWKTGGATILDDPNRAGGGI